MSEQGFGVMIWLLVFTIAIFALTAVIALPELKHLWASDDLCHLRAQEHRPERFADEEKSVTRQIEHACAYAARKGWTVAEGTSTWTTASPGLSSPTRPGFLRLMNALKPRPPFEVLIMSEESRLGREQIETAYALKQIITAGVRVWLYLDDRERTLDSPIEKLMMSVAAFADEVEREKARQRTRGRDAQKARARHVTGGKVYGYRNEPVLGADGGRQHVVRVVDPDQAAVVERIFRALRGGPGHHPDRQDAERRRVRPPRPGPRAGLPRPSGRSCSGDSTSAR